MSFSSILISMIASAASITFVKILFLNITVKLDFEIDRKSANFDFKDPQNIRLDQIITEFFNVFISL